ncbi:MAG: hypothetical protein HC905_25525 [Bacteroidales bacterium]|nr:hypothetical protein [Bacteroidales bacterium]
METKYFITLDGPSHLYNANLIKELISGNHPLLTSLFRINPVPVPNWSGHFIMAVSHLFFSAFISEKIVLVLYLILTPLFFRKTILFFAPKNRWTTYFIFPFLHNHLFYFGFINMSLGIMFMFITISYFLHKCGRKSIKHIFVLSLLLCCLYFSHIMLFMITIALLLGLSVFFTDTGKWNGKLLIRNIREFRFRLYRLLIASVPWLLLTYFYFLKIDSIEKQPRTDLGELVKWITDIRPMLTICYCDHLIIYTRILLGLFVALLFVNLYFTLKKNTENTPSGIALNINLPGPSLLFAFFTISFLFLYLLVPNAIMMSDRLILLFYIFMVCWLALLKYPRALQIVSLIILLAVHFRFLAYHTASMKEASKNVEEIEEIANFIKPDNLVLALNYSDNWLYAHSTAYIGVNKPVIVLENYEASIAWFPLRWNERQFKTEPLTHYVYSNKDLACSYFTNHPVILWFFP